MNYQKLYNQLIEKRRKFPLTQNKKDPTYVYSEAHHIIPKCLNGTDDPNNIINLTAREHFIAHYLLWKIYPCDEILLAFYMFKKGNPHSCCKRNFKNSRVYETARLAYHEWNVRVHTGVKQSEERVKHRTELNRGQKRTPEQKKHISEGRKKSQKTKGHIPWNKGQKGTQMWTADQWQKFHEKMFGRQLSEETRRKIGKSKIGCHWWNNGKVAKFSKECPGEGWIKVTLKKW